MIDKEKVIKGLNDIGGFIAGRVGFEQARNFLRTIDNAIDLLKEQDETIKELQSAYDYLQKQFFEAQDKLLTQDSVEHACEILRANGWKETEPICSECNAVHVVLCKDCKYGHHVINTVNGEVRLYRVICVKPYGQGSAVHEPDWFCADGKRKDS